MGSGPSKAPVGYENETFDKEKEFDVTVEYCGGWGYGKYFQYAKGLIENSYPKAKVTGVKIPGNSGKLEVIINGAFAHSKKNGQGYLTEENSLAMIQKVKAIVEGKK